jgi:hypothetical protein
MPKCFYCGEDANTSGMCDPCDHRLNGRITGTAPRQPSANTGTAPKVPTLPPPRFSFFALLHAATHKES